VSAPLDDESLPRDNGALVFEKPWQARALAIAVALVNKLGLPWEEFRRRLMDEIANGSVHLAKIAQDQIAGECAKTASSGY